MNLRALALAAALPVLASCAANGVGVAPVDLSGFYQLRTVPGSLLHREHLQIFAKSSDGKFAYLGSVPDPDWAQKYPLGFNGLSAKNIAVSADGRSIVYRHGASLGGEAERKFGGLYRHQAGAGETLLLRDAEFSIPATRYPRPLPPDVIAIQRAGVMESVSAEGVIAPLALLAGNALHRAAYDGDTDAIARSAREHPDSLDAPSYWGQTPLEVAVLAGREQAALRLLALGARVRMSRDEHALVFIASAYRRARVLDELLRRNVSYDFAESHGVTPLHALLRFYEEYGLHPERVTDFDSFAATLAVYLRHGADLNMRDRAGRTLLHLVTFGNVPAPVRPRIVVHLIAKGIDVEAVDAAGNTALHDAARMDVDERSAQAWERWKLPLLLAMAEKMKSVDAKNASGLSALQLAVQGNYLRTADYLISRGADASGQFVYGGLGPKVAGQTIRSRIDAVKQSAWWNFK